MRKALGLLIALSAGAVCANAVSVSVFTTLAPNVYGSPSWSAWQSNAIYALQHGLTSYGDPGTPTYYHQGGAYYSSQVMVTGFPSWMGVVDATSVFGPSFASEHGNRMTFPLVIDGQGEQFSISGLTMSATSSDGAHQLDFGYNSYNYGVGYVGVRVGADGLLNTADDEYITSGPSTQMVDFLFGRGSGNSFAAYCDGCTTDAERTAALRNGASYPGEPLTFTATYTLAYGQGKTASDSATFDITPIPEPATIATLGGALLALGVLRRRFRARG